VSVIAALAKTGLDARRFTSRGAGSKEPVAPNTNEEGRAKNRRVELLRL
jgi:outer membrane protein OmpA-like peptidoglycan-associated protein